MALVSKTSVIRYIRQFIESSGSYLVERLFELTNAPVLAGGDANKLFKYPVIGYFILL